MFSIPIFNWYLSNVKSLFADNSRAEPATLTREKYQFFEYLIEPFKTVGGPLKITDSAKLSMLSLKIKV